MKKESIKFLDSLNNAWGNLFGRRGSKNSEENRIEFRLFLQNTFIPELINGVRAGVVPINELFNKQGWEAYLTKAYGKDFLFEWEELQCNGYNLENNFMLITYIFPMPRLEHEHLFAGIIINKETNAADCYFLEYSKPGEWLFGSSTRNGYRVHKPVSKPRIEVFIDWVIEQRVNLV